MGSINDKTDNEDMIARINSLSPDCKTLWGKMTYEDWNNNDMETYGASFETVWSLTK